MLLGVNRVTGCGYFEFGFRRGACKGSEEAVRVYDMSRVRVGKSEMSGNFDLAMGDMTMRRWCGWSK